MFWFQLTKPQTTKSLFEGLHNINTWKQEMSGTQANKETSEDVKSVVFGHCNHLAMKSPVNAEEQQGKLPMMYWLHKLYKLYIKNKNKTY